MSLNSNSVNLNCPTGSWLDEARLDRALNNPLKWKVSLPVAVGWNWMTFKVPSKPKHSLIFNIKIR